MNPNHIKRILTEVSQRTYSLEEDKSSGRKYIKGEFGIVDSPTENKRIYKRGLIEREIKKLQEKINNRSLLGELDHPDDGKPRLSRVSHLITELSLGDDNIIKGKAEILDTDNGRNLRAIAEAGVKIGVSLRGYGSTRIEGDYEVVEDDFELLTFDFVVEPAGHSYAVLSEQKKLSGGLLMENKDKLQVIEEYNKKLEEAVEKIKAEQKAVISRKLEEATLEIKKSVEKELIEKYDSDPNYGLAKQVVEEIVSILKPFIPFSMMDEDTKQIIDKLKESNDKLLKASQMAGYVLKLEQMLANNPNKEKYYELIDFETITDETDLANKVNKVKESINDTFEPVNVVELIKENDKLNKALEDTSDNLKAVKDELENTKKDYEEELNIVNEEYDRVQDMVKEKDTEIENLKNRLAEMENKIEKLMNELDDKDVIAHKLEQELKEVETEISDKDNIIKEKNEEISRVKDNLRLCEAKIEGLRKIAFRPDFSKYEKAILECKSRSDIDSVISNLPDRVEVESKVASAKKTILESFNNEKVKPKSIMVEESTGGNGLSLSEGVSELRELGLSSEDIKQIDFLMKKN